MLSFQDKMMKDCFAGIDHFLGRCVSVNTLQRADPKSLWSEPPGWFQIHQESSGQDMPGCTWWWQKKQNTVFYSVLWRSCSDILLPNCPTWGDRSQGWRGTSRSSCAPPHVPAPGSRDQTWLPGSSLPVQNRLKRQIKAHSEETQTIMRWPKVHKIILTKRKNLLRVAVESGGRVCWEGGGRPIDGDPRSCTGARRRTARPAEGGRGEGESKARQKNWGIWRRTSSSNNLSEERWLTCRGRAWSYFCFYFGFGRWRSGGQCCGWLRCLTRGQRKG